MLDFLVIATRSGKRGIIEIYPKFIIKKSSDLMIRGGDFYAIWIEERGLWSTDEQDAVDLIDRELDRYAEENCKRFDDNYRVMHMWDAETGMIDTWHKYCQKQMKDQFHMLDEKLIFSNSKTGKKDYASKMLNYPLEQGEANSYDKLMSVLYSPAERHKIEWAIGSVVSGDSKRLQKFMVLYGAAGTGKSTVLNIIQQLFDGYYSVFDANGQSHYIDADGNEKLSAINKLKEEGDWDKMSKNLSSQFLSKQPIQLIKKQLDLTYADAADEFSEICSLNNPTVKRKLLLDFADECDSAAVHLKAAALPRQSTQVILPLNAMKETEIFAPNYRDGEKVVLIRYPHGGTFEIPELTVNNKNPTAVSVLGKNIRDAVGINPKVAERLSGADFDGDQVVVIPTGGRVKIQSTPALKDLKDFDPKTDYSTEGKTGVRLLAKGAATQRQMGEISNLITDMTLKGATEPEIARAVKHSMVVIDAAKHKLDYRQSEKDNGIAELKKKYQGFDDETGHHGGASTLLSRRKQDVEVPERQGSGVIDPLTGKVVYKESGRTYVDPRTGKTVAATTKVKRILAVDDVRSMSSGTLQEEAYADYANKMKDLANKARLEYKATPTLKRSASAAKAFEPEVNRLMAALKVAQLNAPLEREAQRIANARVKAKVQANNITDKDEISKIRRAAISDARNSTGASGKRTRITISDGEWTAIQSGAISDTTLSEILRYAEPKTVRERATPRRTTQLSDARISRIKAMANSGHTNAEIAEALGISTSAVSKYLNS